MPRAFVPRKPRIAAYHGAEETPLSKFLDSKRVTPYEMARVTGIAKAQICRLARGQKAPSLAEALRILWATEGAIQVEDWLPTPLVTKEWDRLSYGTPEKPELRPVFGDAWLAKAKELQEEAKDMGYMVAVLPFSDTPDDQPNNALEVPVAFRHPAEKGPFKDEDGEA